MPLNERTPERYYITPNPAEKVTAMRKIASSSILMFFVLFGVITWLAIATSHALLGGLPLGDFRGVTLVFMAILFFYLFAFSVYRLFLWVKPLKEGYIEEGSGEEFVAHVNMLFYLIIFNTLVRTNFVPVPLMRLVYLALGARLGKNTYSAGAILDPPLTRLGDNCIIGHNAVLFAHVIEGKHFSLAPIQIGNQVTIGANAIIMSGVTIGDGAIIAAHAVVMKGTVIGPNEFWGGVPAVRLRQAPEAVEAD